MVIEYPAVICSLLITNNYNLHSAALANYLQQQKRAETSALEKYTPMMTMIKTMMMLINNMKIIISYLSLSNKSLVDFYHFWQSLAAKYQAKISWTSGEMCVI